MTTSEIAEKLRKALWGEAEVEVERWSQASLRITVTHPSFRGKSYREREAWLLPALDTLSEDDHDQIVSLVLLEPGEAGRAPDLKNCEWQYFGDDQWVFGEKVRGLIRVRQGEMYFDPDQQSREGGWIWMARVPGEAETRRGFAPNLQTAAHWVEEALGIVTP